MVCSGLRLAQATIELGLLVDRVAAVLGFLRVRIINYSLGNMG
jgi:hypothetical protein